MANAIYPNFFNAVMTGNVVSLTANTVKVALWDTSSDPYDDKNVYYSDLNHASGHTANSTLTLKTMGSVSNGVFDAANVTFSSVSGNQSEALIFYIDTGNWSTSRLIAYIDTGISGLPVLPNGSDINIEWSDSGIWKF